MGTADNGQPKQQTIVTGPVAATVPGEQLGTNGGGFLVLTSLIHIRVRQLSPIFSVALQ
jgi:K+-transporting ATPase A subunit